MTRALDANTVSEPRKALDAYDVDGSALLLADSVVLVITRNTAAEVCRCFQKHGDHSYGSLLRPSGLATDPQQVRCLIHLHFSSFLTSVTLSFVQALRFDIPATPLWSGNFVQRRGTRQAPRA